jgi:hypothetical protein
MTQFRELVKERQRFKPTESDLYEIENIIKKNSKREVISTELGWKTTHDQYWLFKTATREIESEETSHFLFYSISMNSRHKLSGLAEDYIYIVKTFDDVMRGRRILFEFLFTRRKRTYNKMLHFKNSNKPQNNVGGKNN